MEGRVGKISDYTATLKMSQQAHVGVQAQRLVEEETWWSIDSQP